MWISPNRYFHRLNSIESWPVVSLINRVEILNFQKIALFIYTIIIASHETPILSVCSLILQISHFHYISHVYSINQMYKIKSSSAIYTGAKPSKRTWSTLCNCDANMFRKRYHHMWTAYLLQVSDCETRLIVNESIKLHMYVNKFEKQCFASASPQSPRYIN